MSQYKYKFVKVPIVAEQKGIISIAHKGETFEACKDIINANAKDGWRLKQVVVPFNEKSRVYIADCYEVIFEKEVDRNEGI